jgi:hypothetical protein
MSAAVEAIAYAWMRLKGYTDPEIRKADVCDHAAAGCEFDTNHMTWDHTDEAGLSFHPEHDELNEAAQMAEVALDTLASLGWPVTSLEAAHEVAA